MVQKRILIAGDSIARGISYDDEKDRYLPLRRSFVNVLSESLSAVVRNSARFGNTLQRGADRLRTEVQTWKPDLTLIEFGGNDCDFDWRAVAENPAGRHHPSTDFSRFHSLLLELVRDVRSLGSEPVLLTLPPLDADRYFRWISGADDERGNRILKWIGSITRIYWWQERYNAAILEVARETETRCIDVRSAFLHDADYTQLICRDGIHPNESGHQLIARRVLGFFRSLDPGLLLQPSTTNASLPLPAAG